MIDVKGLQKNYGGLQVLKGVDLTINKGDCVVLIGPSGCGKSTFLRCLNRLEEPDAGHIIFNGKEVTDHDIDHVRQKMGMVFQHFNLFPHLTVKKNITLAPVRLGLMKQPEADAKAMEAERQKLRAKINDLGKMNEEKRKTVKSDHKASDFKVGDTVHVISMDSEGTIMALADSKGKLKVQMGIISAALPPTDLLLVEHEKKKPQKATVTGGKSMNRMMNIKPEINVLGMTVDEATSLVDRFLDDALMAHLHRVTIIHGKGTGALRKGIHQFLKSQPHVKSFRLGEFGEGDAGVTIVEL